MIRVILADDHPLFRIGIRHVLEKTPDIRIIAETDSGTQLLRELKKTPCDIVLLDIVMRGKDALDVLVTIRSQYPLLPVLIVSSLPEDENAHRFLKAGASGYFNKEMGFEEMEKAVRTVVAGKKFISPGLAQFLAERVGENECSLPHERLSDREYQVFAMLARGRSLTEMAGALCLSVKTVSTYRTRIIEKTGLSNNAQIISYAIKHKLV